MAHPLRAVSRLVAMSQRSLVSGVSSEARRNFGTTSLLKKSNYAAVEGKRGSLYHLLWKRKFTWLFVFGGLGFVVYESLHPDRANRTDKMKSEWAHLAGGAYDPTKPQKENKAAKEWLTKTLHFREVFMLFEMNEKLKILFFIFHMIFWFGLRKMCLCFTHVIFWLSWDSWPKESMRSPSRMDASSLFL